MTQTDTKTRILDCAERLFAREGYHATSLRTLTKEAEVNLASVNYHFGGKEALLQAVLERHLLPLNAIRRDKINSVLEQARNRSTAPETEELLRAFVIPTFDFRDSAPGARDFVTMIGRAMNEPDATVRNAFLILIIPLFKEFFAALRLALPQLPPAVLLARLQYSMGALSQALHTGKDDAAQHFDIPVTLNNQERINQLLNFMQAGLEAPL